MGTHQSRALMGPYIASRPKGRGRREPAQAALPVREAFPVMKGHEDGGMFFGQEEEVRERFLPP